MWLYIQVIFLHLFQIRNPLPNGLHNHNYGKHLFCQILYFLGNLLRNAPLHRTYNKQVHYLNNQIFLLYQYNLHLSCLFYFYLFKILFLLYSDDARLLAFPVQGLFHLLVLEKIRLLIPNHQIFFCHSLTL